MASQLEEVVVNADVLETQYFSPKASNYFLQRIERTAHPSVRISRFFFWRRECPPVHFAVRSRRHLVQHHVTRWDHVVRKHVF